MIYKRGNRHWVKVNVGGKAIRMSGGELRHARELERVLKELVACRRSGRKPSESTVFWLQHIDDKRRGQIAKFDLLPPEVSTHGVDMDDALLAYAAHLRSGTNTGAYVKAQMQRIRNIVADLDYHNVGDMDVERVTLWLATQVDSGRLGAVSRNHYRSAIRCFSRWLYVTKRTRTDLLGGAESVPRVKTKADLRRPRRALTELELEVLLSHVRESGRTLGRMSPETRYWFYVVAVSTGFRREELRSLHRSSFDLASNPATVTVRAAFSKRRREDVQALPADIVPGLRRHLAPKHPSTPAFDMGNKSTILKTLYTDMHQARESWIESGRGREKTRRRQSDVLNRVDVRGRYVHFHSLRHTFITRVLAVMPNLRNALSAARLSNLTLLTNYAHDVPAEIAEGLNRLPKLA